MRLVWSPAAFADLARLKAFIHDKNPDAARRAIKTIRDSVVLLRSNPQAGRPVLELDSVFRERLVAFGAGVYVVRYRLQGDTVVLLAVRHGREAG
jgi:plasmid stabilization system protein ParE